MQGKKGEKKKKKDEPGTEIERSCSDSCQICRAGEA